MFKVKDKFLGSRLGSELGLRLRTLGVRFD